MKYVVIAAILSIFIIPLPFSVKLFLSFYDKKLYFSIFFLKIIKLKSCYANISDKSVFFHFLSPPCAGIVRKEAGFYRMKRAKNYFFTTGVHSSVTNASGSRVSCGLT